MPSVDWGRVRSRLVAGFMGGNPTIISGFLRGHLKKRLSVYSPAHLIDAIDNNLDLVGNTPENELNFVRGMLKEPGVKAAAEKYRDMINTDLVLKWLAEDRPDLAGVLVSYQYPKGVNWLEVQLNIVKEQVLGLKAP